MWNNNSGFHFRMFCDCYTKKHESGYINWLLLLIGLLIVPIGISLVIMIIFASLLDNYRDGGIILHHIREKKRNRLKVRKRAEEESIKKAYIEGTIKREDLPRMADGFNTFEFDEAMGLYNNYWEYVRDIVYVENNYCESLNSFFSRNKDLPHYNRYRLLYLPVLCRDVSLDELSHYQYPNLSQENIEKAIDSNLSYWISMAP